MNKVYLNVGFPGSGKSTYSKEMANQETNTIIVSRDSFREMIKGEYVFDLKYEKFIKDSSNQFIINALKSGFDVIIDETHILYERRKEIIEIIREYDLSNNTKTNIICVWFTEKERNLEFRMMKARGYDFDKWKEVIEKMKKSFEAPTINEGFDRMIEINPLGGCK